MKFFNTKAGAYLVLGLLAFGAVLYFMHKAKQGAAAVGAAINPVSDKNIFYQGTNAVGSVLTGDSGFSLGAWIADKFPSSAEQQVNASLSDIK